MTNEDLPEELNELRARVASRLQELSQRVAPVRSELAELRQRAAPIFAARAACQEFMVDQHVVINQLRATAAAESERQAELVAQVNSDLSRNLELAQAYIAARAESWLRIEATIVGPANEWTTMAAACAEQFDERRRRIEEWLNLKRDRWLNEQAPQAE